MAAAATLTQAGKQAWANLQPFAIAGTLRAKLLAFTLLVEPQFPQTLPNGHPVSDWCAVMHGFATTMASTANDWTLLRIAADYLYRMCLMGAQLTAALPTQTTSMLASYNATF